MRRAHHDSVFVGNYLHDERLPFAGEAARVELAFANKPIDGSVSSKRSGDYNGSPFRHRVDGQRRLGAGDASDVSLEVACRADDSGKLSPAYEDRWGDSGTREREPAWRGVG